jgi:hypothetical protein
MVSRAYDVDELLLRKLMGKMEQLQSDVFERPPKTIEEFNIRLGRFLELKEVTMQMIHDAKGIEKDTK